MEPDCFTFVVDNVNKLLTCPQMILRWSYNSKVISLIYSISIYVEEGPSNWKCVEELNSLIAYLEL